MSIKSTFEYIFSELKNFEIVDAHEHLPPEKVRLSLEPDVCFLFSHYTAVDLVSAGCRPWNITSQQRKRLIDFLQDTSIPLEQRWKVIEPYIDYIRYGTYFRAVKIALKEIYGFDKIDSSNYKDISEAMKKMNKPGIYDRILRDKCRARYVLPQAGRTDYEKKYMRPLMWINSIALLNDPKEIRSKAEKIGLEIKGLDDYEMFIRLQLEKWRRENVVGMKTVSEKYVKPPAKDKAAIIFSQFLNGKIDEDSRKALYYYLKEKVIETCQELDIVVAIHAGVWDDFRRLDPRYNIPLFEKFSEVKFDLYHMGMPWVRSTAFLGKNYHNVYLNLCWSHIVSANMARSGLLEYIDIVPINKIIAFGGDYHAYSFEKVVGHLYIAKENVAWVLARLVDDKRMTREEAIEVARMWFLENPLKIYDLS